MLGHPVLELVKELTALGQTQAPLIELLVNTELLDYIFISYVLEA